MIGSVVKEDLIPGLQSEPKKPGIEFHAATRIQDAVGVSVKDIANLIRKIAHGDASIATPEIQKSALYDGKDPHGSRGLNLGTKEPVKQAQVRADCSGIAGKVRDACSGVLFEVVSHLAFHHNVRRKVEAKTAANSKEVLFGELQPGVIKIDAEIAVVFVVSLG